MYEFTLFILITVVYLNVSHKQTLFYDSIVKGDFSLWRISTFAREYRYNQQYLLRAFCSINICIISNLLMPDLCSTILMPLSFFFLQLCDYHPIKLCDLYFVCKYINLPTSYSAFALTHHKGQIP